MIAASDKQSVTVFDMRKIEQVAKSFTHIRCNLYVSPEYNELEDNWCNLYSDVKLPIEKSENHVYVLKHPDCPSLLEVTA